MELSESDILKEDTNQNAISLVPSEVISNNSSTEKSSKYTDRSKTSCTINFVENVMKPQVIYVGSAFNPEVSPRQILQKYEQKDRVEENCVSQNPCTVSFTVDTLKPKVIYVTSAVTSGRSPKQQRPHWSSIKKFDDPNNSNLPVICEDTNGSQTLNGTTTFSVNSEPSSSDEEIRLQDVADSDDILDDHPTKKRQSETINNFDDTSIKLCDVSVDENQTMELQVNQNSLDPKADIHTKQDIHREEKETDIEKENNFSVQSEVDELISYNNNSKTTTTILGETCCSVSVISNYNDNEIEITSNLSLDDCAIEDSQINDMQIQNYKDNPINLEIISLDGDDQIHEPQNISSAFTANEHSAPNQRSKVQTNNINHWTTTDGSPTKNSDKITSFSSTNQNMCHEKNDSIFSRIMFTISFVIRFIYLNCAIHSNKLIIGLILIITSLLLIGVCSIAY